MDGPAQMLNGRYFLTENVRRGAQATVTQAFDTQANRMVAVKRVPFGPDDARAREAFQREARVFQSLRHDNIVDMVEIDRDDQGHWFIVLEWIDDNLEDVLERDGPMAWTEFWDRVGEPILDAVSLAQKRQIAHRDIKPKNILITSSGVTKLADYGIAKLLDNGGAWAPVQGLTFRFDHTPGYTPPKPEDDYPLTRDCYAFAAVAVSCVTGRILESAEDLGAALLEAVIPPAVRPLIERCLDEDPAQRPPLASVLKAHIEDAMALADARSSEATTISLQLNQKTRTMLERRLDSEDGGNIEAFITTELAEICAVIPRPPSEGDAEHIELVGATWRFEAIIAGRDHEFLHVVQASEIGAAFASDLRESGLIRPLRPVFSRPRDSQEAGQRLRMLIVEARAAYAAHKAERDARATQRIFRVWRSYLRDRADLEARKSSAISYLNREVVGESIVFTTEIAQSEALIGQERVVTYPGGKVTGRISGVAFNLVTLEVTYGDPQRTHRRGEISINTIAAQRALSHQTHALDAVVFDRTVSPRLKPIVLEPGCAQEIVPVEGVEPSDPDVDDEKRTILAQALGVEDMLAIEGPPGTGKTKLITEIIIQWLRRNPSDRIMLSSQTHIALDNVLERVAKVAPSLDMIRIGRPDEPRISEASKALLLDRRVEGWIKEIRLAAEKDMERWAIENQVDRKAVEVGMKVERLMQLLRQREQIEIAIDAYRSERDAAFREDPAEATADAREVDETTTQIDSEIGELQHEAKRLKQQEAELRREMSNLGEYAAGLAESSDPQELADWAVHLMAAGPIEEACRERLRLLEDWQLRVGRSSDFNAAMLSAAQVIAGTCVGVASVKGMEEVAYDLCIIDEASKATPTEILIPMVRSRRWIIVGDPKQLPPFFEDFGDELLTTFDDAEVRATLLDRLLDDQNGLPQANRARLRNQYRMIKPIGDLISECFYDGDLESPIRSHGLKLETAFPKPVMWYSTHALANQTERKEGETFRNPAEVAAIRNLLQRLQFVAKAQKRRVAVAVIAGYTAQVEALRDMASRGVAEWPDLDIVCNSVDAFQGRQADVCIYSVVRSNDRNRLGFLKEQPRLNVALSRGKSSLVIVGDQVFCRSAKGRNPFKRVIEYIDQHEDTCAMETLA